MFGDGHGKGGGEYPEERNVVKRQARSLLRTGSEQAEEEANKDLEIAAMIGMTSYPDKRSRKGLI